MRKVAALLFLISVSAFAQNPDAQIKAARAALKQATTAEDSITPLADLGWFYQYSKIDSAIYFNRQAGLLLKHLKDSSRILQNKKEYGDILFRKGDFKAAEKINIEVLNEAYKNKDSLLASKVENNLSGIYQTTGDYPKAIAGHLKALRFYEGKLELQQFEGQTLANIGALYVGLNDNDNALRYYQRAEALNRSSKDEVSLANSLSVIGSINIMQGDSIVGRKKLNEARELSLKTKNYRTLASVDHNLGELLVQEEKFDEALPLLEEALEIKEQFGDESATASTQIALGEVYLNLGDYTKSLQLIKSAQEVYEKNSSKDKLLLTYANLSAVFAYLNQPDSTQVYLNKYAGLQQERLDNNITETTLELDKKYQTEKKERELAQTKAELLANELKVQQRNLYLLLLGLGLFFAIVLGWLIIRQKNLKNRQLAQEAKLKEANAEIEKQNSLQKQRLRISRDLHDNIGSQLTFLISSLDNLRYAKQVAPETANDKLENLSSFTRTTINELRDTIWAMNHDEISFSDLKQQLTTHVSQANKAPTGVTVLLNIDPEINEDHSFNSVKGMHIFRLMQEAINNAVKYSGSEEVQVNFLKSSLRTQPAFTVKVSDQGKGFDTTTALDGNGMRTMQERITEIEGEIDITSSHGKGTQVVFTVPC